MDLRGKGYKIRTQGDKGKYVCKKCGAPIKCAAVSGLYLCRNCLDYYRSSTYLEEIRGKDSNHWGWKSAPIVRNPLHIIGAKQYKRLTVYSCGKCGKPLSKDHVKKHGQKLCDSCMAWGIS